MVKGISIIIPTYNRYQYLSDTIESVISQDYEGELEIIISDDGSTDETLEVAASFGDKVKILRKHNSSIQGAAGARNRGILVASMPLVCFLDSDDFYLAGHLRKIAQLFEDDESIGFAFCRILEVRQIGGKTLYRPWTHKKIFVNDIKNPVVSRSNVVHTNSFMFKREVFNKVGYFNTDYSHGEDGDLWMRISEQFKGAFSNHYGAVYRIFHENNQLTKGSSAVINNCHVKIHEDAIRRYYKLNIRDRNRIFELKHLSLHANKEKGKLLYFFLYFKLILSYPFTFLRRIPVYYFETIEKKKRLKWHTLAQVKDLT
jgi:glycosyltransferase involved in cell wall biosynthesis